jgi:hypothetical protein
LETVAVHDLTNKELESEVYRYILDLDKKRMSEESFRVDKELSLIKSDARSLYPELASFHSTVREDVTCAYQTYISEHLRELVQKLRQRYPEL